jgi:hypothetical protein
VRRAPRITEEFNFACRGVDGEQRHEAKAEE